MSEAVFSIPEALDSIHDQLEAVIKASPTLVPKEPSLMDISNYSSAVTNLNWALDETLKAKERLLEIGRAPGEKGGG